MSVYGYPVPTTVAPNTAPGLFIDGAIHRRQPVLCLPWAGHWFMTMSKSLIPATTWWRWQQKQDTAHGGYQSGENWESMTHASVIASDAEHTVFLKKGSFASRKTDDMLLLQKQNVRWRINPLRKLIFLHMMGLIRTRVTAYTARCYQEQFPQEDCLLPRQHQ